MSFNYPLTFSCEEDLIKHIQTYTEFYESVLDKQFETEHKKLLELHKYSNSSTGSYYIGEYNEQLLQEFIENKFTDWTIDKVKKMKCMDIRMYNKTNNLSISIECKNKKKLTKNDLTKFIADKSTNNFDGHVFISNCSIPNILKTENSCIIKDDNLYIYSKDINTILNYIEVYISNIVTNNTENSIKLEDVETLYNNHNQQKKELLKQDKVFLKIIHNKDLLKNHLYITTKSNCKSSKPPY